MTLKLTTKKDDIQILNTEFKATFIPVHGPSSGTIQNNLDVIFALAEAGDIVGGDFNINFLEQANVDELAKLLDKKGLKVDISEQAVESLKVYEKARSESSLYSQQLMKNGEPDIFLKDLSFKLIKKNTNEESSIPSHLQEKLTLLQKTRKTLISRIEELKKNNAFNESSITLLCAQLGVVRYQNLNESFGNDHPHSYYLDKESNTLFFSQNSFKHKDYDFKEHFQDGNEVNVNTLKELYSNLDKRVYTEMYYLLATRDGIQIEKDIINQLPTQEKISFIKEHLISSKKSSNEDNSYTLSKEHLFNYFNNILRSNELLEINNFLKTPYKLSDDQTIESLLASILSNKNLEAYANGIDRIINVAYQALSPDRPKKGEQTIALNGNGFLPFRTTGNKLIPSAEIEKIQIDHQIKTLQQLHAQYPTAILVVAMIEAEGQDNKCNAIKDAVEKINNEVKNRKVTTPEHFIHKAVDMGLTIVASKIQGLLDNGIFHTKQSSPEQENPKSDFGLK